MKHTKIKVTNPNTRFNELGVGTYFKEATNLFIKCYSDYVGLTNSVNIITGNIESFDPNCFVEPIENIEIIIK